jgi:hypothetical protein
MEEIKIIKNGEDPYSFNLSGDPFYFLKNKINGHYNY